MECVVKVADVDQIAIQQPVLLPPKLLRPLLGNQQPRSQLLGSDLEEAGQLVQIHCSVQPQVRLDCATPHVRLDLIHEDGQVVLDRILYIHQ